MQNGMDDYSIKTSPRVTTPGAGKITGSLTTIIRRFDEIRPMIAGGYGQILILLSAKPNPSYAQLSTEIIAVPLPPVLCVRQMMCVFDNTIFLIQNKNFLEDSNTAAAIP